MMKKIGFVILVFTIMFGSCNPDQEPPTPSNNHQQDKQYSYWVVNQDSFSTNEVKVDIGLGSCAIGNPQTNHNNRFDIVFNVGRELPKSGTFLIVDSTFPGSQNPSYASLDFRYNNIYYYIPYPTNSTFMATDVDGKAQYILHPTWFINYFNHNDSVLIHGIFREP